MIRLRSWPAVKQEVRDDIRALVRRIPKVVDIPSEIIVYLEPAAFWMDSEKWKEPQCGEFYEPSSGEPARIRVCGLPYDYDRKLWLEGEEGLRHVRDSLLHEIGHFIQYRDGKKLTERVIKARTESLYRLLYGEAV
jgi:hypothetical protein